jgi:predicted aspartyl protease
MNPRVKEVAPEGDYRLRITFTNGETGVYDCRPLLDFGVFRELRDLGYFRLVRAANGTVAWPHEQDLCPDTVYLDSVRAGKTTATPSTESKACGMYSAGMIKKKIKVSNSKRPEFSFEDEFWIDSEVLYSFVPEDILEKIEVESAATRTLTLADGRQENRPLGFCDFEIEGMDGMIPCPVIFAPKGSLFLLGATALKNFGVEVDPIQKRLKPILAVIGGFVASSK